MGRGFAGSRVMSLGVFEQARVGRIATKAVGLFVAVAVLLTPGKSHAQCTTSNPCLTAPTNLGTLGPNYPASVGIVNSEALAVNSNGSVVVGYTAIAGDGHHAFLWTAPGGLQDLGTLGGPAHMLPA
jgi:probable HAF family extracellular repeat protein